MTELTDLVPPNAGVDATTELGDATYNLGAWARAISAAVEAVEVLADAAQTSAEVSTAVAAEATLARNADNLTSGTVADARIASTIARDSEVSAAIDARLSAANATDLTDGGETTLHSHAGGGGAMQVISRTVLGSDTASVDFTSIPSTYETLVVHYTARTTATGATWVDLRVRFNGDDATNYAWGRHWHQGGSGGLQNNASGATSIGIATILDADATANYAGTGVIQIPGYARTVFVKQITSTFTAQYANSNTQNEGNGAGLWASTAAINQVTFLPASGNFKTGTVFTLYGLNGA